jgi:hypothetical protein
VAPLRLGGLRGKQSTPSDWLGGTGVVSTVGERERHGALNSGFTGYFLNPTLPAFALCTFARHYLIFFKPSST